MFKAHSLFAGFAATALALTAGLVAAPPGAAATCTGVAGEFTAGHTISTRDAGSSCSQTRARTYAYVGGGTSVTTYGSWGVQSIAYKSSSGTYSGGAINARYPTKFWAGIPGLDTHYAWSFS